MHFLRKKEWKITLISGVLFAAVATSAFATKVTATVNTNLHKKGNSSSEVVAVMKKDMSRTVLKTSSSGNWYKVKVNGVTGYVRKNYVKMEGEASSTDKSETSKNEGDVNPGKDNDNTNTSTTPSASQTFRNNVVALAKTKLGCDYVYGATGPSSFDCSGLCQWVYSKCGVSIPRTSSSQYSASIKVSRDNLKKGYLVFFNTSGNGVSHVGIYIGNNNFIHAANSKTGVVTSSLSEKYYASRYVGAGRFKVSK